MDASIHNILLQNDSSTDVEFPPGFDWQASIAAVKALKPGAERILGQPLKLSDQVQDASFFAELFVFEDGAVGPNGVMTMVFKIAIRFSTFGRMATIHTNSAASDLGNYPVARLADLLGQNGFQYIPAESLAERYDGRLKQLDQWVGGEATWWYRFFDYM
ncbi:MAG: hypothetical protein ACJ8C4_09345 [Gemmataceae bacterium]